MRTVRKVSSVSVWLRRSGVIFAQLLRVTQHESGSASGKVFQLVPADCKVCAVTSFLWAKICMAIDIQTCSIWKDHYE